MKNIFKKNNDQKGMVAILALIGLSAAALAILTTLLALSVSDLRMARSGGSIDQTYYAAESGLNDALLRLRKSTFPGISSYVFNGINITTKVNINPANPYQRIIESKAADKGGKIRTIKVAVNTNSFSSGFDFAIHGGSDGVMCGNDTNIIYGDIYVNGNITNCFTGGDVWTAGISMVDNIISTSSMYSIYSHNITESTISGQAYYMVIDSASRINGVSCNNSSHTSNCHSGSPDPVIHNLMFTDAYIQKWKDGITASGTVINPSSGTYKINSDLLLGKTKINGNLILSNNLNITLTGNIWVTGYIDFSNNNTVAIDPSIGKRSLVIIADKEITVSNNVKVKGSGDPSSFIFIVSLSPGNTQSNPAIDVENNSESIVFIAPKGMLSVKKGVLKAVEAKSIYLDTKSIISFDPNLSAFTIIPSGNEFITTQSGTWEEN